MSLCLWKLDATLCCRLRLRQITPTRLYLPLKRQLQCSAWKLLGQRETKMASWFIHHYGSNDELRLSRTAKVPIVRSPDELLIDVHAAGVNPIDVRMREGYGQVMISALRRLKGNMTSEFPLTLGRDFSGTVMEVGKAVKAFRRGDEVWGALGAQKQGTHAQFTIASEGEISKKPRSLTHVEAASIPYVAVTSWTALCEVGELDRKSAAGKRVLVLGGSGGIGTFAVQFLKAWNAEVTATCSSDFVERLQELGANAVIDYNSPGADIELARLQGFDFILDAVGKKPARANLELLRPWKNAKYVSIVTPFLRMTDEKGLVPGTFKTAGAFATKFFMGLTSGRSYRWALFIPNRKALATVSQMVDAGQIKPVIEKIFSFEELPAAYARVEAGHLRGKCVIDMKKM